jgi:hypothetical protein
MARRVRLLVPLFLVTSLFAPSAWAATESTTEGTGTPAAAAKDTIPEDIGITRLIAIITAIGALGTAAFGLVDATKAFGGGVSNFGLPGLNRVVSRFSVALDRALGKDEKGKAEWRRVVRSHWINGRSRGEQKAILKSLIRLGLTPETARALAEAGHVKADALATVAAKIEKGDQLGETELNVLGRLDASVEAQLDAAFDRADQLYRNVSRAFAAVFSILLTFLATWALGWGWDRWALALVIGFLAVPLAPIAKDLASSLQAAAAAMKAAK